MDNEKVEDICMKFIKRKHGKRAVMKTPFWTDKILRPKPHAILAYEIYSNPINPREQDVVRALNSLVRKKKIDILFSKGFVWYCQKN